MSDAQTLRELRQTALNRPVVTLINGPVRGARRSHLTGGLRAALRTATADGHLEQVEAAIDLALATASCMPATGQHAVVARAGEQPLVAIVPLTEPRDADIRIDARAPRFLTEASNRE